VKLDFFGYNKTEKTLDATKLRKAIFGGYVSDYMKLLSADQPDKYKRQFSKYIAAGITPQKVEDMYKNAHKKIRATPLLSENKKKIKKPVKKDEKLGKDGKVQKKRKSDKPKKDAAKKEETPKKDDTKEETPEKTDKPVVVKAETPKKPETKKAKKPKKPKSYKKKRLTLNERRARVTQKLALKKKLEAAGEKAH